MPRSLQFIFTLLLVVALSSCSGGGFLSPDVDHKSPNARSVKYKTVIRGDTLFSIAWDIGVDFRTLARWNGIRSPYVIKPGQRLRVSAPKRGSSAKSKSKKYKSTSRSSARYYRVKKGDTVYGIARKTGNSASDIVRLNGLRKPYRIYTGQRLRLSGTATRTASQNKKKTKSGHTSRQRSSSTKKPKPVGRWVWPAKGKILRRYSPKGASKGLDIGGRSGSPIRASAAGRVVYQGSGLRGYGKLIIVKHNSDYLSAYAHCSSILVKEGSRVKRGQRIATMGSTGTNRVKLHFEIRLRGNPVNPLRYLPAQP
jgi:lipoprotein NlpD